MFGIRPPEKNIVTTTIFVKNLLPHKNVLESGYAIRLVMMSAMAVPPTAYKNVLPYALKKFG